jgi:protein involved in polysaccharide export with SLBB domain
MIRWNRILVGVLALCLGWLAFASDNDGSSHADPPATAAPTDLLAQLARPTNRPGIIQPGDWLRLSVDDLLAQNKTAVVISRVNADGTADFPMLGFIAVAGMSDSEAQLQAGKAYKAANIIADPHVMVRRIYLGRPGDPAPGPVHPFDLVRIDVMDLQAAGLSATTIGRVSSDGRIGPPQLGSIKIADLTDAAAAKVISKAYRDAQMIPGAYVKVTTLEAAPPDAEHLDLPDGPVYPVPDAIKPLFQQ